MKCPLQIPHVLYVCMYKFTMRNKMEHCNGEFNVWEFHFVFHSQTNTNTKELKSTLSSLFTYTHSPEHQVFWMTCLPLETIFKYSMSQTTMISLQSWP